MKTNQTEMDLGVKFKAPKLVEVIDYGFLTGLPLHECEKFHAYYSSNGWKVGKNKMKSWRSAVDHWKLVWREKVVPPKTAFHYKTVLEAKQRIADEIKNKYCLIVAGGKHWTNQDKRQEYSKIMSEIRQINEQIAAL
jgi:hypothetical protein